MGSFGVDEASAEGVRVSSSHNQSTSKNDYWYYVGKSS